MDDCTKLNNVKIYEVNESHPVRKSLSHGVINLQPLMNQVIWVDDKKKSIYNA